MLIEQLMLFDKAELAVSKLIFLKYRMTWLIILLISFIGIGISLYAALISDSYLSQAFFLVLMPSGVYFTILYSKRKTYLILRMYCIKYGLQVNDIWKTRYLLIKEIQLKKLATYLERFPDLNPDKIKFVIDILRTENASPRYKYQVFQVFSLLFSVIVGGFFAAIIVLPNMFTSWENVMIFFRPIIGFALLFVLFTWFIEEMLLKNIFKLSANKHSRLIRILENYNLKHF